MYSELFEIWQQELESNELTRLPADFYPRITNYLRKLNEESRMLDKRTAKANLLNKELLNVKRMVREVIKTRYRKMVKGLLKGEKIAPDTLTPEEERIYTRFLPLADAFRLFAKDILHGRVTDISAETEHKRAVLRFLKDVPAIIGTDLKIYGPFAIEDVASLPIENVKMLIKQGLAEKVEVS